MRADRRQQIGYCLVFRRSIGFTGRVWGTDVRDGLPRPAPCLAGGPR